MKSIKLILVLLSIVLLNSCKTDDASPVNNDLGTFKGSIQVVDDPSTQLGYITNAQVSLTANGSLAIVKIIGDLGFDREYTGEVLSAQDDFVNMSLEKQTKPSQKIAAGSIVVDNNSLVITLDIADDNVSVRRSTTNEIIIIQGKLSMIGTSLLRQ